MPSVTLKKMDGSDAGSLDLAEAVFGAPRNEVVVREALNGFLANQRQGTHATKTRGLVRGGGKKPWKQKGTGRARAGSIRSPLWKGGGTTFGPQPRDYREKVNRRKRRAALRTVLSARAEEGRILAVDAIDLGPEPKTRSVAKFVDGLEADGRVLIVTKGVNELLLRCARNIPHVDVVEASSLCFYDVLVADTVILTKDAIEYLQEAAQ